MRSLLFPTLLVLVILLFAFLVFSPSAVAQRSAAPSSAPATGQAGNAVAPADDPIFAPPHMPTGKVSLIGGKVEKLDQVRNRVTVKVFGGDKLTLGFDERTRIYRDGAAITYAGLRRGDRVYVDSMLDGGKLFARNIRVVTELTPADARGQLVSLDKKSGNMMVRDDISDRPISFRVTPQTTVKSPNGTTQVGDLRPGTLLAVRFSPDRANRGVAREVEVLATPGTSHIFSGKLTHLDLRSGTLAVENRTDNKIYDIKFRPASQQIGDDLMVGAEVTVKASFDGKGYTADSITVTQTRANQ